MNNKYKLVIFDLIDTLADGSSITETTKVFEEKMGTEILDLVIGGGKIDTEKTADEVIARVRMAKELSAEQERLIRDWMKPSDVALLPHAIEILEYLKKGGYLIGIISNSPPTNQDQLGDLGITSYIDSAVFSFECGYRKPSKEIYDLFLKRFGILPSDAIMIGDSLKNDALGAQSAGVDAILLDKDSVVNFSPKIKDLLELKDLL